MLSGAALWLLSRLPILGKLPGDILISKGNFNIFIPIVTMIIVSVSPDGGAEPSSPCPALNSR